MVTGDAFDAFHWKTLPTRMRVREVADLVSNASPVPGVASKNAQPATRLELVLRLELSRAIVIQGRHDSCPAYGGRSIPAPFPWKLPTLCVECWLERIGENLWAGQFVSSWNAGRRATRLWKGAFSMRENRVTVWVQRFADRPNLMLQWVDPETGQRKTQVQDC